MNLWELWENNKRAFGELDKIEFDGLYRQKKFIDGPLVEEHSQFMKEYGPYAPERWAFGQLQDGEFVCAMVAVFE